jgi:hypothetical protein
MINPQWGFNPIIIRMLFAVTLFQQIILRNPYQSTIKINLGQKEQALQ